MKRLRDYQSAIIHGIRRELGPNQKKRVMVKAPTGAGKTVIAGEIVRMARDKGNRVAFIVPAISLINQTVESFREHGIDSIGVMQATHEMTDPSMPVQVCSMDTLSRRKNLPLVDLIIVDEAHRNSKFLYEWMQKWSNIPFIGLSATPWTRGLGEHWEALVNVVGCQELIDQGHLSPFVAYAPSAPDLENVKVVRGDYDMKALGSAVNRDPLIADIVQTWLKLGENRPTILYAVDRAHAQHCQKEFQQAGIGCGYIDAYTEIEEREAIHKQLVDGDIRVVCNVGCLTTGIDWDVRCLILARPTKSRILYVQIVGRGLRTAEGKNHCLILDHSDTTHQLGFVTDIDSDELDDGKGAKSGENTNEPKEPKICPKCKFLKPIGVHICPECGFAPQKQTDVETVDGELELLTGKKAKNVWDSPEGRRTTFAMFLHYANDHGFKSGWAWHKTKERCGGKAPPNTRQIAPIPPDQDALNFIKHMQIRNGKRRAAAM